MEVVLTTEQINKLDKMMEGIAYLRKDVIPREYTINDIKQEFWIVAMKCIAEQGSVQESLIAKKCYSKIVDLIRASARKSCLTIDPTTVERMGNTEDGECEYGSDSMETDSDEAMDSLIIRDMLSKFRKGTKEYDYLKFLIKYCTSVDIGETYDGPDKVSIDRYLADLLGFASSSSGGYRRVRNKVRTMVRLYRKGIDMNMVYALEDLGFSCYGECMGWKRVVLKGASVDAEVYESKSGKGYTLFINHEEITDFDTISELKKIMNVIKSMR